eukprot:365075-Chlamydomonas_euryale.AAC.6
MRMRAHSECPDAKNDDLARGNNAHLAGSLKRNARLSHGCCARKGLASRQGIGANQWTEAQPCMGAHLARGSISYRPVKMLASWKRAQCSRECRKVDAKLCCTACCRSEPVPCMEPMQVLESGCVTEGAGPRP